MVYHPHSAVDGKVIETQDVLTLKAEEQDHLSRPDTDALKGRQKSDGILIRHLLYDGNVKVSGKYLFGEILDVFRFPECHSEGLKGSYIRIPYRFRRHCAKGIIHPLPDGLLCLGGDLLADDVVDNGRKQVCINGTVDVSDPVYGFRKPWVFPFQIFDFRISIFKKQSCGSFTMLLY